MVACGFVVHTFKDSKDLQLIFRYIDRHHYSKQKKQGSTLDNEYIDMLHCSEQLCMHTQSHDIPEAVAQLLLCAILEAK